MHIHYILHAEFELPGYIEEWAKKKGYRQTYSRPFANEPITTIDQFNMLVLMGGPQSPLKIDKFPYLKDEIQIVKQALKIKKRILGFCLGAQLIGEALEAKTEKSPNKEVGVFPIRLTSAGLKDPFCIGLPNEFHVMHWHEDMPGVPKNGEILAASKGCPRQLVRFNSTTYGFQCHPEIQLNNVKAMISHCPDDLSPGTFIQSKPDMLKANFDQINSYMDIFLNNFIACSHDS